MAVNEETSPFDKAIEEKVGEIMKSTSRTHQGAAEMQVHFSTLTFLLCVAVPKHFQERPVQPGI